MLDKFAERLAWDVHAREQLVTRCRPALDATGKDRDIGIAIALQDCGGARRKPIAVVAQYDRSGAARHELGEFQFQPTQRYGARQQQMPLREDQLLAHIDKRKLAAAREHAVERLGAYRNGSGKLLRLHDTKGLRIRRHVACCGVIRCTSPVLRSNRTRSIRSRFVPVTRMKRAWSG